MAVATATTTAASATAPGLFTASHALLALCWTADSAWNVSAPSTTSPTVGRVAAVTRRVEPAPDRGSSAVIPVQDPFG